MGRLRLLDNQKIFGCCIVPTVANVADRAGQYAWSNMYLQWDTLWPTWIKPQIDMMVGNGIGANCFRIVGASWGIVNGLYSQDYYDTRLMQAIDYCASLGAYYMIAGGDVSNGGVIDAMNTGMTPSSLAQVMSTTFAKAQTRWNVIGADVIQEAQSQSFGNAFIISLLSEIRSRGITLPLTCSALTAGTPPTVGDNYLLSDALGKMGQYFDFINVHPYFRTIDHTYLDQYFAAFPDKDIIFGEWGRTEGDSKALITANAAQNWALCDYPDRRMRGGLMWSAFDQTTVSNDQWGCYDNNGNPRYWRINPLRQITGGSLAKANSGHR